MDTAYMPLAVTETMAAVAAVVDTAQAEMPVMIAIQMGIRVVLLLAAAVDTT